jgi:hypothetical protein
MRLEPYDKMMDDKLTEEFEDKVTLIENALAYFGLYDCPYCGCYIGLNKYIDRSDIEEWLWQETLKTDQGG